jgi:PleD family two-component response regulator
VAVLGRHVREEASALLQRADDALYAAKGAGRARGVVAPDPPSASPP